MLVRSSLLIVFASLLSAQQETPCGPYRVSLNAEVELTAAAFGASEILDLCLTPMPSSSDTYFGFVLLSSGAQAFTWQPGNAPVITTQAGVPSATSVRSICIGSEPDSSGRLTVLSMRTTAHPFFYQAYVSKVTPDGTAIASDEVTSSGWVLGPPGYTLGRIGNTDVLMHVDGPDLRIEDIDIDPSSAAYGTRSNLRNEQHLLFGASDVLAIRGSNGSAPSLLIAQSGSTVSPFISGPTIWFRDVAEGASMPTVGATNSEALTSTVVGLKVDWIAQIDPSTFLVQYENQGPQRMQLVSTSSTAAPIGQTTSFDVRMPSSRTADPEICFGVISFAGPAAQPVPAPSLILGNLCVSTTDLFLPSTMVQNTGFASFPITVPNDPFWVGVVLTTQGLGFEFGSPNSYLGNLAAFEIVN